MTRALVVVEILAATSLAIPRNLAVVGLTYQPMSLPGQFEYIVDRTRRLGSRADPTEVCGSFMFAWLLEVTAINRPGDRNSSKALDDSLP